jgi:hypothetical protein
MNEDPHSRDIRSMKTPERTRARASSREVVEIRVWQETGATQTGKQPRKKLSPKNVAPARATHSSLKVWRKQKARRPGNRAYARTQPQLHSIPGNKHRRPTKTHSKHKVHCSSIRSKRTKDGGCPHTAKREPHTTEAPPCTQNHRHRSGLTEEYSKHHNNEQHKKYRGGGGVPKIPR